MADNIKFSNLTADETLFLRAKEAYYKGEPIMSDEDFDILEAQLETIDSFVVGIVGTLKETKSGFKVSKGKIKFVQHDVPMGSLDKVKFTKDYVPFKEFENKFLARNNDQTVTIEAGPKLDGNAGSIKYVDGALVHIASRGDGKEGQDYTHLPLNVPKFIKGFTGEIRGEFVIETAIFDAKYGKDSDLDKKFANARNFVAGSLAKGEKDRVDDIDFVAFNIEGYTANDSIKQLTKFGFQTLDFVKTYNKTDLNEAGFVSMYKEFEQYRKRCKYQLDGIVLKYPEHLRSTIGGNSHHPYWAVAVKFVAEIVSTTVIGIEWSLGKRGQMAPVAILEDVDLMGSVVKRASLYNASWLLANKCYPGATVSLIKSGDIIPKIVEILVPSTEQYDLPTDHNGNQLSYNGVDLVMVGFENTQEYKSLIMYHTISALGIKGIGPATAAKISEAGIDIKTLLTENASGLKTLLLKNDIFKDGRELEVLINNVLDLTKVELWEVIYSFGYRNCGRTVSKQLANYITGIKYDFKGLEKSVVEAFINDQSRIDEMNELVEAMKLSNINVVVPEEISSDVLTFEMTGENPSGETKGVYRLRMEANGKALHSSLKAGTTYLVTDSLTSSSGKMKKAEKLGINIVTYAQFEDIINNL